MKRKRNPLVHGLSKEEALMNMRAIAQFNCIVRNYIKMNELLKK